MEYQALQLVSSLEHYGVEWHWVRDATGQRLAIGVGPEGIAVCKEDFSLVNRYAPYRHLQVALCILVVMVRFFLNLFQELQACLFNNIQYVTVSSFCLISE